MGDRERLPPEQKGQEWTESGSLRLHQGSSQGIHSGALGQVFPRQAELLKHSCQPCRLPGDSQIHLNGQRSHPTSSSSLGFPLWSLLCVAMFTFTTFA